MTAQILVRLSAVLLSAFLIRHEVNAQTVDEFSTRAAVVVPNGTAIARTTLPGPSIAALRSANGGDLRVFNAAGLSLPHAVIDASRQAPTSITRRLGPSMMRKAGALVAVPALVEVA